MNSVIMERILAIQIWMQHIFLMYLVIVVLLLLLVVVIASERVGKSKE